MGFIVGHHVGMATDDKMLARKLGNHIRALRGAAGWTQEDLADVCGIHANFIGTLERGEQVMSIEIARRIAAGLGRKLSELLNEVGE
jgi:transcriptional regulator with XRE-family HTH domain